MLPWQNENDHNWQPFPWLFFIVVVVTLAGGDTPFVYCLMSVLCL